MATLILPENKIAETNSARNATGEKSAMTITLTPDIEQALTEESSETGTAPEKLAVERLRTSLALKVPSKQLPGPTLDELALMDRVSRVRAIMGSSAHLGPSRLWEDREEERVREERQNS